MSKINAVRFININYNNNTIRINDECLYFGGNSTLISLENGGGKSVMVQMLMAPFVQKSFRDVAERPFASYFKTAQPSFIMVEWVLDGHVGFVLTGMMVRRNQHLDENNENELEIITFVAEYDKQCAYDIFHLGVVTKEGSHSILKSFAECRQLFESLKKEKGVSFFYYDMNSHPQQSRTYFSKLAEYGIHTKEWQSIIRIVNREEGGLSKIFAECKDERKLLEKWIFPQIETKLNNASTKTIAKLQESTENYMQHCYEMEEKMAKKEAFVAFHADANAILDQARGVQEKEEALRLYKATLRAGLARVSQLIPSYAHAMESEQKTLQRIEEAIAQCTLAKYSALYHEKMAELKEDECVRDGIEKQIGDCEQIINDRNRLLAIFDCLKILQPLRVQTRELAQIEKELAIVRSDVQKKNDDLAVLGSQLKTLYHQEGLAIGKRLQAIEDERCACLREREQIGTAQKSAQDDQEKAFFMLGGLNEQCAAYEREEDAYFARYKVVFPTSLLSSPHSYPLSLFAKHAEELTTACENLEEQGRCCCQRIAECQQTQKRLEKQQERLRREREEIQNRQRNAVLRLQGYEQEIAERAEILAYFSIDARHCFDMSFIRDRIQRIIDEWEQRLRHAQDDIVRLKQAQKRIQQGFLDLPEDVRTLLEEKDIPITYGLDWVRKHPIPLERKQALVRRHPLLPYALLFDRSDIETIAAAEPVETAVLIPLIPRDVLAQASSSEESAVLAEGKGCFFYAHVNEDILDEGRLALILADFDRDLAQKAEEMDNLRKDTTLFIEQRARLQRQTVTEEAYAKAKAEAQDLEKKVAAASQKLTELSEKLAASKAEEATLRATKEQDAVVLQERLRQQEDFARLFEDVKAYGEQKKAREKCEKDLAQIKQNLAIYAKRIEENNSKLRLGADKRNALLQEESDNKKSLSAFANCDILDALPSDFDAEVTRGQYDALVSMVQGEEAHDWQALEKKAQDKAAEVQKTEHDLTQQLAIKGLDRAIVEEARVTDAEAENASAVVRERTKERDRLWEKLNAQRIQCTKRQMQADAYLKHIEEECQQKEPLAPEAIPVCDFDQELYELHTENDVANRRLAEYKAIRQTLDGIVQNYAPIDDGGDEDSAIDLPASFSQTTIDCEEIRRFLARTSRQCGECETTCIEYRQQLFRRCQRVYTAQQYNPIRPLLPNLEDLADNASRLVGQLTSIMPILQGWVDKITADIAGIDEELASLSHLFLDYLEKVQEELQCIDDNSSIKIHNKSRKTLQITVPGWEDCKKIYEGRLRSMLEGLRGECLKHLKEQKPIHDWLATRLSTKEVFDAIIGIAEVGIHLVKVEATRDILIPWNQVATNSGGESLLSSFFVLSSLLSYMRHNEGSFIKGAHEGKVLLMDNPFGKTNAQHLLEPLMDLAKKNNVQLICLTGLCGDSIYDCFDHIFVINLIPADERGLRFVTGSQHKGAKASVLSLSHLHVAENASLLSLFTDGIDLVDEI